jgi:rare lipoprotein A
MKALINSKKYGCCLKACCIFVVSLTMLLFLAGCSSHRNYTAPTDLSGYSESGKASYYAEKYQNRKTASGERFNNYLLTAAHKSLPFGTKVIVTNINNGKTVMVSINDRGPYVKGRIIDLTQAAFSKIESIDKGLAEVKIRVVN